MALRPEDLPAAKAAAIPDGVIEVVDAELVRKWNGTRAILNQPILAYLIAERMGVTRQEVFARKWLDFEEVYRANGWKVTYDKPAYNEPDDASFTFEAA